MGQYYIIVNEDKEEFLTPNSFYEGRKLMEFGPSSFGVMCALAALLAESNGEGGGDIPSNSNLIGRWCGDRIVIAGDYSPISRVVEIGNVPKQYNLYSIARSNFKDISLSIRDVLLEANVLQNYEGD